MQNFAALATHAASNIAAQVSTTEPYERDADKVLSYKSVRISVGLVGLALPIVLLASCIWISPMPGSISGFYYTPMRNYFVGSLFALGIFLFSYRYAPRDNVLSVLAALLIAFVGLCPTADEDQHLSIWNVLHLCAATAFLLLVAGFSYFLFTRTEGSAKPVPGSCKALRNKIYRGCGVITCAAVVIAGLLLKSPIHLLFWWEAIAVWAFSFSWLVKGGLFFKDRSDGGGGSMSGQVQLPRQPDVVELERLDSTDPPVAPTMP